MVGDASIASRGGLELAEFESLVQARVFAKRTVLCAPTWYLRKWPNAYFWNATAAAAADGWLGWQYTFI